MNKSDLYALSDLVLQKLSRLQSDEICGNIERGLLQPYAKQLAILQNAGLIQTYANEIFGSIVQTIFCKTLYELSRKEPDIDKLWRVMKPVEDFMRNKIGYDQEEIQRRIDMSEEDIESDLKALEKEIAEWVKDMPHVVVSNEVPDEIKDELNRLKEQVVNMKKENLKWKKH